MDDWQARGGTPHSLFRNDNRLSPRTNVSPEPRFRLPAEARRVLVQPSECSFVRDHFSNPAISRFENKARPLLRTLLPA